MTLLTTLVIVSVAVALANYFLVHRHFATDLAADPRNKGIEAIAHYEYFVLPSILVFDLRAVSGQNSAADVFRVLLQFADSQKSQSFSFVNLAHRGTPKFLLKGEYFQKLGHEYGTQNPVYTMRTLPENLYRLDGTAAFGTWTGGWIGVLGKQMQDFADFHKQWYIDDIDSAAAKGVHSGGTAPAAEGSSSTRP